MSTPGLFIAFEGGEGAGKSTQAAALESALLADGYHAALVREPGSTKLGDYLRSYLVAKKPIVPLAELLLFEASRAQLVTERIRPLLDDGAIVIADRFAGSTVAYQGHGRGMDLEQIRWLNDAATGGLYPDMTILLDIDPLVGLGRLMADAADRFEDEEIAFHKAVRQGFHEQEDKSGTWCLVEGNHSIDDVAAAVWARVNPLLPEQNVVKLACAEMG
ncbi:Thymidylate kinase [Geodia barretti]|uniref:dTMP kinase n=1 Tax=Geodia barretti TaxID=519541 RepID=A0AA35U236_GEOBA|nr:Thymidylate kinase [Geodia barretti]